MKPSLPVLAGIVILALLAVGAATLLAAGEVAKHIDF